MFLKQLRLQNFKKFQNNAFDFSKGINVVIGQNDSGKSTLLQAIDICLNQRGNGDWRNKSEYGTLLNVHTKNEFLAKKNKSYQDLPKISVEVIFSGLNSSLENNIFDGTNNYDQEEMNGISFEYSFDEQFIPEFNEIVHGGEETDFVPFEFYTAKWNTFGGQTYNYRKNPLKSILIDTDRYVGDSYRNFTKQVFSSLNSQDQREISISLKKTIGEFNRSLKSNSKLPTSMEIDPNRMIVQDNLDVFADDEEILLRDMGSGTENMIKTRLAMNTEAELVLLEEPENHLSFDLVRQQIENIMSNHERQVIVTTHSPLTVSRLNIKNIKWLNSEGNFTEFDSISDETAQFFLKADNIDVLQVILAKRIILVEGATEYIVMEDMIKQVLKKSSNDARIHVVSMSGNFYKRFREIVNLTGNKALFITDNDGKSKRITEKSEYETALIKVSMPNDQEKFTFEVALFDENNQYFNERWNLSANSTDWKKHNNLDKKLVWMLENKTEAAIKYEEGFKTGELKVPIYIEEGIKWLIK